MIINFDDLFNKMSAFLSARNDQLKNDSWRCLYANISTSLSEDKQKSFFTKKTAIILNETLSNDDGHLFLFPDGDIFIFFQGRTQILMEKIPTVLKALLDIDAKNNIKIYDLSRDLHNIKTFHEKKLLKQHKKQLSNEQNNELFVDPAFIAPVKNARLISPPQILIIEDDPFIRRMIRNVLKDTYQVIEAGSGQEGVKSYFSCAPDVVFLDIEMPGHSGLEVLEFLKKNDPAAFIAMLTSSTRKQNIQEALRMGAKGFIAKPFTKSRLLQFIDDCPSIQAKNKKNR